MKLEDYKSDEYVKMRVKCIFIIDTKCRLIY